MANAKKGTRAVPKSSQAGPSATGASDAFQAVVTSLRCEPTVSVARMFGAQGLKVGGKVFAMEYKGDLVVKLPRHRVEELIASGDGKPFDPGHGRIMKEWVAIQPQARERWLRLAGEAQSFVTSQH